MRAFKFKKRNSGLDLITTLVKGAIPGAAGVWVMDKVGWALWNREDSRALAQEESARAGGMDPAHALANKVANFAGVTLAPAQPHPAGIAVHYALGIVPGMLYGVFRGRVKGLAAGRGLLYGLGLFLVLDEAMARALRLAGSPTAYPWQAHARGLASHLVLGAVTDGTLGVLDRAA